MVKRYRFEVTDEIIDAIDESFYDYNLDDQVWFEDGNRVIATENPLAAKDIEMILEDIGIEYTIEEE